MNSILLKENVNDFMNRIDTDTVLILADLSIKYQSFMKEGNSGEINATYKKILDIVTQNEETTGIKILNSSDDSYIIAINALSGLFQCVYEKQKQKMAPETIKISFDSIVDADIWLHKNPNVAVETMDVSTGTSRGYFANHSYVESVTLYCVDYKRPTGYVYGICEEERSRHYFSSTLEEFILEWREENPEKEFCSVKASKNTRGEQGAINSGIGVSENTSYYVLYRRKIR